jgi:hypothetical protein
MPKKAKSGKRKNRSWRSRQERNVEHFLEYARSIGIDLTDAEFQRALEKTITPKRRVRQPRRASSAISEFAGSLVCWRASHSSGSSRD